MGKTLTNKANTILKILFVFAMLLGSFSHARVNAQTLLSNNKVTVETANTEVEGGRKTLHLNIDGDDGGSFSYGNSGTGIVNVTAKEGYTITSMTVSDGSSSINFESGDSIVFGPGNSWSNRTLNITTTAVGSAEEYTMTFTAGDHVTLTVPSGVGYQEITASKEYSLTLESTETLPELPTAVAETGYETPTWSPALPTTLTSSVDGQTYTASTIAKVMYTLSYDYGTASMNEGTDGLPPALPASQTAYANETLIVANNVNLMGNSAPHAFFVCWSTKLNDTPGATLYFPGDEIEMTDDIVLYPIFGPAPSTYIANYYVHTVTGQPSDNPELEPRPSSDYQPVGVGTISIPPYNITGASGYQAYYTGSDLTSSGYLVIIPTYTTADLNTMFGTTFPEGTSIVWYVIKDQPWESSSSRYHVDGYIVAPDVYYDVTFSIDSNTGALSGTTSYSVEEDTLLSTTVTALPTIIPVAGYEFQSWQLVGTATTFANDGALSTYLSTHNATADLEFRAMLSPIAYTLNIDYVFSDGNKPASGFEDVEDRAIDVNSDFTVVSPTAPAGYSVDVASVVVLNPTGNITRTVTYSPIAYTLNIDYVFSDGNKPASGFEDVEDQAINVNSDFTVVSPTAPAGYSVDVASVVVLNPTGNITRTVTYSPIAYTLNIDYVFSDGNKPASGFEDVEDQAINVNSDFTVVSPTAPAGYSVDVASVVVLNPTGNITRTVTYSPIAYTLNIDYVFSDGNKPASGFEDVEDQAINVNSDFTVVSPTAPAGYSVDVASVVVLNPTADISVTATYSPIAYTLNIDYVFSDGNKPASGFEDVEDRAIDVNSDFTITSPTAPAGYSVDVASVVVLNPTGNITRTVTYSPIAYTLNIDYVFSDGNKPASGFEDVEDQAIDVNSDFTITSPTAPAGYSVDVASVVVLNPTGNITRTVTYSPIAYTLNIDYVFSDGNKPASGFEDVEDQAINVNSDFTVVSPTAPAGYSVDVASVVVLNPTGNITRTVTYSPIAYTLNIDYVFSDGNKPASGFEDVEDRAIDVNSDFTVVSPTAPAGYSVDVASVVVLNPTGNITRTVTYSPIAYTLNIDYVFSDGNKPASGFEDVEDQAINVNSDFTVVSPTAPAGYSVDVASVVVLNPTGNITRTVTYSPIAYTLNIDYVFSDGNKPASGFEDVEDQAINVNSDFTVVSPTAPAGYSVDVASVVVLNPTADISVTATYSPIAYTLNIDYVFSDGNKPASGFEDVEDRAINVNSDFTITSPTAPAGYSVDVASVVVLNPTGNITRTVTYSPIAYTLNIDYVFSDGNKPASGFEDVEDRAIDVNSDFTITSPTAPAGYSVDVASVVVLNPTGNITRTVTYTPITYRIAFVAEDHVTLSVPSDAGYFEPVPNKVYLLDYNVNSTLPELPIAVADPGYDTPTWDPVLPTALAIELDATTYRASTNITEHVLNISYVFSGSAKPATGFEDVVDQAITVEDSFTVVSPAAPANHTVNITSVVVNNPTANISVTVTYTYIPPVINNVISFVAGAGGSLSGTTSYTFVSGTAFGTAVTAIPATVPLAGYRFVGWTPLLPAAGTAISANITFTALFELIPPVIPATYTVTFSAGDGGSLTGTQTITVDEGTLFSEVIVPTPVAAEGYEFDAWTPELPADATEINEDLSFVAIFNEVEEIVEPETPETPEVAADGCWIHWLMLFLTLIYGLYEGIRLNKKEEDAQKGGNK